MTPDELDRLAREYAEGIENIHEHIAAFDEAYMGFKAGAQVYKDKLDEALRALEWIADSHETDYAAGSMAKAREAIEKITGRKG